MTKSKALKLKQVHDGCRNRHPDRLDRWPSGSRTRRGAESRKAHRRKQHPDSEHLTNHFREREYEEKILRKISKYIQTQKSQRRQSAQTDRRYGPALLISRIFETWGLDRGDAATLLGFERPDHPLAENILNGYGPIIGRDTRDRIAYLIQIRNILYALFRDDKVENEWLRESHSLLGNQAPLDLLLEGSMENLLLVKHYCDEVGGM